MTVGYWLKTATSYLQSKGITTARLDCLVLLEETLKVRREKLLAEPRTEIRDGAVERLQKLLNRRARHEPLAYIRGRTEFYGRTFVLTKDVLEPRPESENMVDILKDIFVHDLSASPHNLSDRELPEMSQNPSGGSAENISKYFIADVGTGSGALGITAALELPGTSVDLLDIDEKALKVAKTNVDLFTLNLHTVQSDLLLNAARDYDILLCNLPYVPDNFTINPAAMHEPKIAIFGGSDGLDVYRKLFEQLKNAPRQPLYILTESLPPQHELLTEIAALAGYSQVKSDDFIQLFKYNG